MLASTAHALSLGHSPHPKATTPTFITLVIGNRFNLFPSSHHLSQTGYHWHHHPSTSPTTNYPTTPCTLPLNKREDTFTRSYEVLVVICVFLNHYSIPVTNLTTFPLISFKLSPVYSTIETHFCFHQKKGKRKPIFSSMPTPDCQLP